MINVRPACRADLDAITEIYNEAIVTTTATFDLEPRTREQQLRWFEEHGPGYPILVAEEDSSPAPPAIVGWASLSKWSDRCAYNVSVESSLYIRKSHRGRGIGRQLYRAIIDAAERLGYNTVLARITAGNEASLKLSEQLGFIHVGVLQGVGRKFGQLLDVHLMQKLFE